MPRLLLAEDDHTMVSLLKTLLGMEGFQVETLLDKSGEMLENIRRQMPDILLLDVHLGNLNGIELVQQIRQTPEIQHLKIIMFSGIDMEDQCLTAGADDFLMKPYMPDDLIQKLRALTG